MIFLSILLFFSLFGKQIFFFFSPQFEFYFSPAKNYYLDDQGNLDVEKYIYYQDLYCDNENDDFLYLRQGPFSMCEKGKYIYKWDTIEQYIQVFDYYNENNKRYLYKSLINYTQSSGKIDEIIENYKDKTFQAYIINATSNLTWLKGIQKNAIDDEILELINESIKELEKYDKEKNEMNNEEINNFWDKGNKKILKNIKAMKGVNIKVF